MILSMLLATQQQHNALLDVPSDVLENVVSYLSVRDLSAISQTRSYFYEATKQQRDGRPLILNNINRLNSEHFLQLALAEKEGKKIRSIKLDLPEHKTDADREALEAFINLSPKIVSYKLDVRSHHAYARTNIMQILSDSVNNSIANQPLVNNPALVNFEELIGNVGRSIADLQRTVEQFLPTGFVVQSPQTSLSDGQN